VAGLVKRRTTAPATGREHGSVHLEPLLRQAFQELGPSRSRAELERSREDPSRAVRRVERRLVDPAPRRDDAGLEPREVPEQLGAERAARPGNDQRPRLQNATPSEMRPMMYTPPSPPLRSTSVRFST